MVNSTLYGSLHTTWRETRHPLNSVLPTEGWVIVCLSSVCTAEPLYVDPLALAVHPTDQGEENPTVAQASHDSCVYTEDTLSSIEGETVRTR